MSWPGGIPPGWGNQPNHPNMMGMQGQGQPPQNQQGYGPGGPYGQQQAGLFHGFFLVYNKVPLIEILKIGIFSLFMP
jgi:hypothetical protein